MIETRRSAPIVASTGGGRLFGMRKLLAAVGSVVLSAVFGLAGAEVGVMTGFMLGMVGTGLGMYAGSKLAERLGA